jgi:hypothetical protein
VVEVVTPGPESTLVQLMEFPLLRLAEPVWIDERHLAVFGRGAEDSLGRLHQELMFLDVERPLVGVKLDLTAYVGSAKVAQVLPVVARRRGSGAIVADATVGADPAMAGVENDSSAGLDVFLLSGKEPRQIHRVHVDVDVTALLGELDGERRRMVAEATARGAESPAAGTPGVSPEPRTSTSATGPSAPKTPAGEDAVLVSLVPLERTVHDLLAARGEVWDLTIDPQQTRLAFTWQPEAKARTVIATLALDGVSTIRPAGRERGAERRPRFDGSGRRLVFEATFPLSVMERMLAIPGLSRPVR